MRYGYCTGFANDFSPDIDYPLLDAIKAAGYDYVEFPLMTVAALSEGAFGELVEHLGKTELAADCMCNLFPAHVRVTGESANERTIASYLKTAFPRARALGVRKLVFGSAPARNLDDGMSAQEGYAQLIKLIKKHLLPKIHEQGMMLVMEPICRPAANFVVTMQEAMQIVDSVRDPAVALLTDTAHMLASGESAAEIHRHFPYLRHIHITERDRLLPFGEYSPELTSILRALRDDGYDETVSFEPLPAGPQQMREALARLKAFFSG